MTISPADPRLVYVGRFDRADPSRPRASWPATSVELRLRARTLSVRIVESPLADEIRDTDSIQIVVDGVPVRAVRLAPGEHLYPILDLDRPAEHRVAIVKRTEPQAGTIELVGLELDPGGILLAPPARPLRRIEFIGDSITAGFGNEGRGPTCPWNADEENAWLTFATEAARALDAEPSVVAWSGKGVYRNANPREQLTMPELWARTAPMADARWAFADDPRDAVVINLGTNDFQATKPPMRAFGDAYLRFYQDVRARRPEAVIFVGMGPMLVDDVPPGGNFQRTMREWLAAFVAARREAGDTRIERFELYSGWPDQEGFGCQFHPSLASHRRMGAELAYTIRTRMGW